mmetsp:Transcript_5243/g.15336  ORF Transcript_5243/g.15336 Transcript_5243/m.15336 type:complete len:228 (-) Transcript_5243:222-905(-)
MGGSMPPDRRPDVLAQCIPIVITAARSSQAPPASFLTPLLEMHEALVPVQGSGTDALCALSALVRERADTLARGGGRPEGAGRRDASAPTLQTLVRAAPLLAQLLLPPASSSAAEPRGDASSTQHALPSDIWLPAVAALCAAVDALAAMREGAHGGAGSDGREVVEQALRNLLLCAAAEQALAPPDLQSTLELVQQSSCTPDTVDALAALVQPAAGQPAGARTSTSD